MIHHVINFTNDENFGLVDEGFEGSGEKRSVK